MQCLDPCSPSSCTWDGGWFYPTEQFSLYSFHIWNSYEGKNSLYSSSWESSGVYDTLSFVPSETMLSLHRSTLLDFPSFLAPFQLNLQDQQEQQMTAPLDPVIERHVTLAIILPWILNDSPTPKYLVTSRGSLVPSHFVQTLTLLLRACQSALICHLYLSSCPRVDKKDNEQQSGSSYHWWGWHHTAAPEETSCRASPAWEMRRKEALSRMKWVLVACWSAELAVSRKQHCTILTKLHK